MDNENVPYRATISSLPAPATTSSVDENEFSTLQTVRKLFAESIGQLNSFNAFDLTESEMKIKQQIKAHELAYDILAPLLETIDNTIMQINSKYKKG